MAEKSPGYGPKHNAEAESNPQDFTEVNSEAQTEANQNLQTKIDALSSETIADIRAVIEGFQSGKMNAEQATAQLATVPAIIRLGASALLTIGVQQRNLIAEAVQKNKIEFQPTEQELKITQKLNTVLAETSKRLTMVCLEDLTRNRKKEKFVKPYYVFEAKYKSGEKVIGIEIQLERTAVSDSETDIDKLTDQVLAQMRGLLNGGIDLIKSTLASADWVVLWLRNDGGSTTVTCHHIVDPDAKL